MKKTGLVNSINTTVKLKMKNAEDMTIMLYRGNMCSIFSCNSEAKASELLENIERMFPRYW